MSFIVTADGDELSLSDPRPEHLRAWSIAWSLAQINRFNGHAIRPYSVAEHSLLVAEIAERELGLDVHGQLGALMHDAHEAVAGDMHSPGKQEIGLGWAKWEQRWLRAVHGAFALQTVMLRYERGIERADRIAVATEKRDLLPRTPTPWPGLEVIAPVDWVDLNAPERRTMGWEDWRDRFLDRYHELDFARNEALYGARGAP